MVERTSQTQIESSISFLNYMPVIRSSPMEVLTPFRQDKLYSSPGFLCGAHDVVGRTLRFRLASLRKSSIWTDVSLADPDNLRRAESN
jgi:hypothetical protein